MAWYVCTVNEVGPAVDGTETSDPVIYINLTDYDHTFNDTWFYAANGMKDHVLNVGISAIIGKKYVEVAASPPNSGNNPYTEITRIYERAPIGPPPAPTGLHLISLSAEGGPGATEALLGWTAVPAAGSIYRIDYEITVHDAASPGSGGGISTSTTNQVYIILTDGHTYNIYVQAAYFDSNIGVVNGVSAPSNTIVVVVSALPLPPSISATVVSIDVPPFGPNYGLFIKGSNFGKSEQVSVTVTWTVSGEPGSIFPLGVFTTDALIGSFATTFTGNTPAGFCPITVPFGQPQPAQNFSVTATDLTSKKTFSTTAGPFTCPFSAS